MHTGIRALCLVPSTCPNKVLWSWHVSSEIKAASILYLLFPPKPAVGFVVDICLVSDWIVDDFVFSSFLQSIVTLQNMLKKVSQSPFHNQYKVSGYTLTHTRSTILQIVTDMTLFLRLKHKAYIWSSPSYYPGSPFQFVAKCLNKRSI